MHIKFHQRTDAFLVETLRLTFEPHEGSDRFSRPEVKWTRYDHKKYPNRPDVEFHASWPSDSYGPSNDLQHHAMVHLVMASLMVLTGFAPYEIPPREVIVGAINGILISHNYGGDRLTVTVTND